MNARQRNAAIKAVVAELTGLRPKSVTQSDSWCHITLRQDVPNAVSRAILERLVQDKLCGTYWPDIGPGAYDADGKPALQPSVSLHVEEP